MENGTIKRNKRKIINRLLNNETIYTVNELQQSSYTELLDIQCKSLLFLHLKIKYQSRHKLS